MASETWLLIEALRSRTDLAQAGRAALAQAFPEAPSAMLDTAAFHLFTEGCEAAFGWLVSLESFLRRPKGGLDYGATWHLLYHLYNWQQFQALLPCGPAELGKRLEEIEQFLVERDVESVGRGLRELRAAVEGGLQPPNVE